MVSGNEPLKDLVSAIPKKLNPARGMNFSLFQLNL